MHEPFWQAPDGSVREREVCKMGAIGLCPRGDHCRYAHITESELGSEDSDESSESNDADGVLNDTSVLQSDNLSQGGSTDASRQSDSKVRIQSVLHHDSAYSYRLEVSGSLSSLFRGTPLFQVAL